MASLILRATALLSNLSWLACLLFCVSLLSPSHPTLGCQRPSKGKYNWLLLSFENSSLSPHPNSLSWPGYCPLLHHFVVKTILPHQTAQTLCAYSFTNNSLLYLQFICVPGLSLQYSPLYLKNKNKEGSRKHGFWFFFIKKIYLFIFREREREKERERNINMWLPLVHPLLGTWPVSRHVPWLGTKLATLWFIGLRSIHWAIPVRADYIYIYFHFNWK